MSEFLQAIIEAHGGMERWNRIGSIELVLNFSGMGLEAKGFPRHLRPRATIDTREQRVVFQNIGEDAGQRFVFTPDKVWSEQADGNVIAELDTPREACLNHPPGSGWDRLHLTYFMGYAFRNYLMVPFIFADPAIAYRELDAHVENGETWRVLEVTYPPHIPVHTSVQRLYFGSDRLLRRVDYVVDVFGGSPANHYCYDYRSHDGIMIPTLRRVVSPIDRGPLIAGRTTIFLLDYVALDLIER